MSNLMSTIRDFLQNNQIISPQYEIENWQYKGSWLLVGGFFAYAIVIGVYRGKFA